MRILVIGAHPDDCELQAAGSAALWAQRGDVVRFLSVTDGGAGHQHMPARELVERRRQEAARSAAVLGIEHEVLGIADGQLLPAFEHRQQLIRAIRRFAPDLVLTHRSCDYHPDHRYTAILVQDSAYMVMVPLICPEVPALKHNPVFGYLYDHFQRPSPLRVDVAVDVDAVMEAKWAMLHQHTSQVYEWLPHTVGRAAEVPAGDPERRRWLQQQWSPTFEQPTRAARAKLSELYGAERGAAVRYAEAFEISEYGRQPSQAELKQLFPLP